MKIAFLEDVPNVAKAGDVKEVSDGYARNYLIPKKLGAPASTSVTQVIESKRRASARKQAQAEAEMIALGKEIESKEITIEAKKGAKDRIYGSVTAADIATALAKQTKIKIDKKKIEIAEPIRQIGKHEVTIRLSAEVTPKLKVTVVEKETE